MYIHIFLLALTANAHALLGMQALAERASSLGVAAGKLKWHQRVLEDEAYIQRLAAADLVLDTSWHNSIGTVLDALWAATPVVSMASERASSRAAASALIAAGTPQALARNLHDYDAVARALVRRRSALYVCLICLPYVSVLCVCLMCLPYVSALCVCLCVRL